MAQESSPSRWWRRALRVGLLSFFLAAMVTYLSDITLARVPALIALLVVLILVSVGVLFDVLGTSVTAADLSPLNAMAAKRINGARQALWMVRNADRVSNFTNDVVGDVAGAVSGAAGTTVALQLSRLTAGGASTQLWLTLGLVGLIAGLTVGGKAAGKSFAIERATYVVMLAGRALYGIERVTGRSWTGGRGHNSSRRRSP